MEPIQDADGMWLVVIQGSSITRKFGSKGEALAWIEDNTPKDEPVEPVDEGTKDDGERQRG